ncbi:MAG: MoaD/ThiS family protein, partial [Bacteroidales bacterium]|nr:MoaD/ThiS family protein [Bacteroidales bacterium]
FLTVRELKEELKRLKPGLAERVMMVSVNDKLVEDSGRIENKDKVLIFHPFAGG